MNNKNIASLLAVLLFSFMIQSANAELFNSRKKTSQEDAVVKSEAIKPAPQIDIITSGHIKSLASLCVNNWESEGCLKELSALSMDMTVNYAEKLDAQDNQTKKEAEMESLKQHCAASTAALKISVPAYAMRSAITECVNTVSDLNKDTAIKPDVNLYQLLVGSVLCLSKDLTCENLEKQLHSAVSGK